jgi:hypothetical protein
MCSLLGMLGPGSPGLGSTHQQVVSGFTFPAARAQGVSSVLGEPGSDLSTVLGLDFNEAITGSPATVTLDVLGPCGDCKVGWRIVFAAAAGGEGWAGLGGMPRAERCWQAVMIVQSMRSSSSRSEWLATCAMFSIQTAGPWACNRHYSCGLPPSTAQTAIVSWRRGLPLAVHLRAAAKHSTAQHSTRSNRQQHPSTRLRYLLLQQTQLCFTPQSYSCISKLVAVLCPFVNEPELCCRPLLAVDLKLCCCLSMCRAQALKPPLKPQYAGFAEAAV